jgi:hypothetical protein
MLEPDTGHRNPQIQRQVPVTPDMEAHGIAPRAHHVFSGRVHDVEVAPPDGNDQTHAEHGRRGGADAPVLLVLHARHPAITATMDSPIRMIVKRP